MSIQLQDGSVLLVSGAVANDPGCCCGGTCPSSITASWTVIGHNNGANPNPSSNCAMSIDSADSITWTRGVDYTCGGSCMSPNTFSNTWHVAGDITCGRDLGVPGDPTCSFGCGECNDYPSTDRIDLTVQTFDGTEIDISFSVSAICRNSCDESNACGIDHLFTDFVTGFSCFSMDGVYNFSDTYTESPDLTVTYDLTVTVVA